MQDPVIIEVDSQQTLSRKKYWGIRLVFFSVLMFLLSGAIGFNQLVTNPNQNLTILGLIGEAGSYVATAGLIAGIILLSSRKKNVRQTTGPITPFIAPLVQSAPYEQASLAQITRSNTKKLVAAILCFTVPTCALLVCGLLGILMVFGAGDGSLDPSAQVVANVLGIIAITAFTAIFPGIIAGVVLLIRRRKVIYAKD